MDLQFKSPPNGSGLKWQQAKNLLDDWKVLDTNGIAWVLFTSSMLKGVVEGCQAMLKKGEKQKIFSSILGAELREFHDYRRKVYYLRGQKLGRETSHDLLINKIRIPIELMQRMHLPYFEIEKINFASDSLRDNGIPLPATTLYVDHQTTIVPDMTSFIRLPDDSINVWFFEADNGTEDIIHTVTKTQNKHGLLRNCLGHKVVNYENYRQMPDQYFHEGREFPLRALQVLFVFQNPGRMDRFRKQILSYFKQAYPFIWMTTREQIEDPRDFWCKKIWRRLVKEPESFALIDNGRLANDPLDQIPF